MEFFLIDQWFLCTLQDDALVKVYNIYSSSTAEHDVRLTAAQQIAIMMEGTHLFKCNAKTSVLSSNIHRSKFTKLDSVMLLSDSYCYLKMTEFWIFPVLLYFVAALTILEEIITFYFFISESRPMTRCSLFIYSK